MINRAKKLSLKEIKVLKREFQSLKFDNDFDLVYESQIPNTGIVLICGELSLFKKKKIQTTIRPGNLIGLYELMNNVPADSSCKVLKNSELIMIHKTHILEALEDKDSELYDIIKDNIA